MLIYQFDDYKAYIVAAAEAAGITFAALAAVAKVQPPYISMVLRKNAHLSVGQVFAVGKHLRLGDQEIEYLLLLVQAAAADRPEAKTWFLAKITRIQQEKLKLSTKLAKDTRVTVSETDAGYLRYYLNIQAQILHMLCRQPRLRGRTDLMAARLGRTEKETLTLLGDLAELRLVQREGSAWTCLNTFTHIESGSVLSAQNHVNWRLDAVNRRFNPSSDDFRYTATISATAKTKLAMLRHFQDLVVEQQQLVREAPDEELYQINFDIYAL